jgi:hypothetical protein
MRRCMSPAAAPGRLMSVRSGEPDAGVSTWKSWKDAGARLVRTCKEASQSQQSIPSQSCACMFPRQTDCRYKACRTPCIGLQAAAAWLPSLTRVLQACSWATEAHIRSSTHAEQKQRTHPARLLAWCACRRTCCAVCACTSLHLYAPPALPACCCHAAWVGELQLYRVQQQVMLPVLPLCLDVCQQAFGLEPAQDRQDRQTDQ